MTFLIMGRWILSGCNAGLVNGHVYWESLCGHISCKCVIRCISSDGCGHNLELNQLPLSVCVFYPNRGVTMRTVLGYIAVIVRSQCRFTFKLPTDKEQSSTWNSRWSNSKIPWIYFTYQSAKLSVKKRNVRHKMEAVVKCCLSMTFKWTNNTFTVLH